MKIRRIRLKDHPLFGTADISFTDKNGETLDTVVIAGINGSGKTTLLETLLSFLSDRDISYSCEDERLEMDIRGIRNMIHPTEAGETTYDDVIGGLKFRQLRELLLREASRRDRRFLPKIIYMPTQINFEKLESDIRPYIYEYTLNCEVRDSFTKDVPKYLATYIDRELYRNEDVTVREAVRKATDEINSLFSELDVDAKIVGLKKDGSRMPIFRNSAGKEFDITKLSSGEKQLFIRMMALRMAEANNSVILVDEPEISLHPRWQQRILRVYENIGKNNQVIAATHSPHLLSSAARESVRILIPEGGKTNVANYDEIDGSYGLPAERVLVELMGLDTTRDPGVERKFEVLRNMVRNGNYETDAFRSGYKELEDIVGTPDQDLVLIQMEIDRLRRKREKSC